MKPLVPGNNIEALLMRFLNREATDNEQIILIMWMTSTKLRELYFVKFIRSRKIMEYHLELLDLMDEEDPVMGYKKQEWIFGKFDHLIDHVQSIYFRTILRLTAYCCEVHFWELDDEPIGFAGGVSTDADETIQKLQEVIKNRILMEISDL